MVKTVAANWKAVNPATIIYIETLAALLKKRHEELRRIGGMGCISVAQEQFPKLSYNNSTSKKMMPPTRLQMVMYPIRTQIALTQETAQSQLGRMEWKVNTSVQVPPTDVSQANSPALDDLAFSFDQILPVTYIKDDFLGALTLEQVILNNQQHNKDTVKYGRMSCREIDLSNMDIIRSYCLP